MGINLVNLAQAQMLLLSASASCMLGTILCSVTRLGLTVCDPMDCNPPDYFVHGVVLARTPEWVDFFLVKPVSPALAGGFFTTELLGKPLHGIKLDLPSWR